MLIDQTLNTGFDFTAANIRCNLGSRVGKGQLQARLRVRVVSSDTGAQSIELWCFVVC